MLPIKPTMWWPGLRRPVPHLIYFWPFWEGGGGYIRDVVRGTLIQNSLANRWRGGSLGFCTNHAIAGHAFSSVEAPRELRGSSNFSAFVVCSAVSYTASACALAYRNGTDTTNLLLMYPFDTSGGNGFRVFLNGGTSVNQNDGDVADGLPHVFFYCMEAGSGFPEAFAYRDGVEVGSGSESTSNLDPTPTSLDVGRWRDVTQSFLGNIYAAGFFDKCLTASEVAEFSEDVFAALRPRTVVPVLGVPTAAAVGDQVTASHVRRQSNPLIRM